MVGRYRWPWSRTDGPRHRPPRSTIKINYYSFATDPPAAKCVPGRGSSGESYGGARRERSGTCGSAIYAGRRAHDNAIRTTGYVHRKIVRTPALRAAETGWAVHRDCGGVADNQVGAVFEGVENVANAAAEAR